MFIHTFCLYMGGVESVKCVQSTMVEGIRIMQI